MAESERILTVYPPEGGSFSVSVPVGVKPLLDAYLEQLGKRTGVTVKRSQFVLWAIREGLKKIAAAGQAELITAAAEAAGLDTGKAV